MKKLILLLLLTSAMYSQKKIFNIQHYCIDELPFKKGDCNLSGTEYSFVFLDTNSSEVIFFLTDIKLKYKIVNSTTSKTNPVFTSYILKDAMGEVEMRVNKQKTRIEFLYPDKHIYLKVGKSTKSQ